MSQAIYILCKGKSDIIIEIKENSWHRWKPRWRSSYKYDVNAVNGKVFLTRRDTTVDEHSIAERFNKKLFVNWLLKQYKTLHAVDECLPECILQSVVIDRFHYHARRGKPVMHE